MSKAHTHQETSQGPASPTSKSCPSGKRAGALALRLFERMLVAAGPRGWWPRDLTAQDGGRDEAIIGAVLAQNTTWKNVERALVNLKDQRLCCLSEIARREPEVIAPFIRSAGYFNLKARRLRAVADFFAPGGRERFAELVTWPDETLRQALLGVYGVGPETADCLLLYALGRTSFVIDTYTLRIGRRHGIFNEHTTYEEARAWFTRHAAGDRQYFNEYHALLVWVGNQYCKPTPRCTVCPLATRDCCAHAAAWREIAPYRTP